MVTGCTFLKPLEITNLDQLHSRDKSWKVHKLEEASAQEELPIHGNNAHLHKTFMF